MSVNNMDFFGGSSKREECAVPFGIDLGTTNSAISVVSRGNAPEIINLNNGRNTMPSCVLWEGHEKGFVVGTEAYKQRYRKNAVYSVKKLMQETNEKITLEYNGESITLTPTEISAEILKGLVKSTNGLYGEVKDVVVTVPAYFTTNGIKNTREACVLAGLNPIGILAEPTAAALNYDLVDGDEQKNIVVFDLGGGTFDVSFIRICNNTSDDLDDIFGFGDNDQEDSKLISVLGLGGDANLGGDDYDKEIYKIFIKKLADMGYDTSKISVTDRNKLILLIEGYKKKSIDNIYLIKVGLNLNDKNHTRVDETIPLTPADFREAFDIIYARTKKILDDVLKEVDVPCHDIVLVGGSTKNPYLMDLLHRDYPDFNISNSINPDESVATGAAIKAKLKLYKDKSVEIFDAIPMTIGVLTNGSISQVIPKNSQLPISKSKAFTTIVDNQTEMAVQIFQGNSKFPEECVELGSVYFDEIEPRPAGVPNLVLKLTVNVDGLLTCEASIDGVVKTLELKLGGNGKAKELSKDEKNIIRFSKMAEKITNPEFAQNFNNLLDSYKKACEAADEAYKSKIVSTLMKTYREYLDNETSK